MRKLLSVGFLLFLLLMACSSDENSTSKGGVTESASDRDTEESAVEMDHGNDSSVHPDMEYAPSEVGNEGELAEQDRMVMYNANLTLEVKDIPIVVQEIMKNTEEKQGYIVETSTINYDEYLSSFMVVRIPSPELNEFLSEVESLSDKVREKEIHGTDVTEEYTDLQSRLKAKRTVEERLLTFLKEAEKTEDLLKISEDLASVQEEIETLEGRKKYLENRTDYASIEISLIDISVNVPEVPKEDLQTGDKIKKTFANSLNSITKWTSSIVVFIVGYSPILFLLLIIGAITYYVTKKKKSKKLNE